MRLHGEISEWREDRGFGFITPTGGGDRVFVHISAFAGGRRPRQGDQVTYDLDVHGPKGARATQVRRVGEVVGPRRRNPARWMLQVAVLAILAVSSFLYFRPGGLAVIPTFSGAGRQEAPLAAFECLGKRKCSEMTSCEEARFYLANCPGVEIDGDGDGIPCESQWCAP